MKRTTYLRIRDPRDVTNNLFMHKSIKRNSLILDIIGAFIFAALISIPFSVYFWRM
jgi:hypothetical protein